MREPDTFTFDISTFKMKPLRPVKETDAKLTTVYEDCSKMAVL